LSLEREVEQMINDLMKREEWTKSHTLSILRSKFESEERYQEVEYVDKLIKKEKEEEEIRKRTTIFNFKKIIEKVYSKRLIIWKTSRRQPIWI
jgi:hypothetical protein